MEFGGDWNKLVAYLKALEARVAALEAIAPRPGVVPEGVVEVPLSAPVKPKRGK